MSNIFRAVGVMATLLLASLGIAFVFDVIPREQLQTLAEKSLVTASILLVAGVLVRALTSRS